MNQLDLQAMKLYSLLLITLLCSCSTIEILDGLCYNDKEGTHICPTEE